MSAETIYSLFADAAHAQGGAEALALRDGSVSYAAFHDEVLSLVAAFSAQGEAVAILSEEPRLLLAGFFACAALGRPALILDPALPGETIARLLARYEVPAVFASDRCVARLPSSIPTISAKPDGPAAPPLPHVDPAAEFYWGLTSGTTGEPKVFARSHASWTASFAAAEAVFDFPPGSRVLVPGPLHHSLFLYGAVHALCRGFAVLLPGQFRATRLAASLGEASHLYAVPFMLHELAKARHAAPGLRMVFSGGAKLSGEERARCERLWPQADLVEFYGASETSFLSYHSTRRPAPPRSVGRVFPNARLEIRDAEGCPLPPEAEGEIAVSGPMLFSRYVGEAPPPAWFGVGDTGYLDSEGCLHLTGRLNRVINSKALKIHPEQIEAALMELPEVRRAAVVGIPEAARGAVAVAAIEAESGGIARSRLSAHCRRRLGPRLCPRRYYVAEALPLTPSGKVAVARLREALLAGDPAFTELI